MAEAVRTAQQMTGRKVVSPADVRAGLEALHITNERLTEAGLEGFMEPLQLSCTDHSGHGDVYIQQWTGEAWEPVSDWFAPMVDVVRPRLEQAAAEYEEANAPWPEREVPCAGE
jgi:branched-chain amino acid transport system substrate-binding protein